MKYSSQANAEKLRSKFEQLIELSTAQMEALDNDRLPELAELLHRKDELLREIDVIRQSDAASRGLLKLLGQQETNSTRDLIDRYQAHEKYVMRQIASKLSQLGDRMQTLRNRRHAAQGYSSGAAKPTRLDTTS